MPIFYYHPFNKLAKEMAEATNERGFMYTNRGELDLKLLKNICELGYDNYMNYHTVLGTLAGNIQKHMSQTGREFDPDDPLDSHTIKLCRSSKTPWSFVKVINGPDLSCVVGYFSTPAINPYNMTTHQMAEKGIINVSHTPIPV